MASDDEAADARGRPIDDASGGRAPETETETETETAIAIAIATDDGVGTVEDGTTETIEEAGVDDTNRTAATTDGTETTETTEDAIDTNK